MNALRRKKAIALLFAVLAVVLLAAPPATHAYSRACDQYASCHSPGDCAWWGVRCALYDPVEFITMSWDW